jgi:tRNA-specific 2-thiouridylase
MNVVVGLSGGVDSAVAALLLKRAGHAVTGLFMKNWEEDDTAGRCSAEEDLKQARAVCAVLDIPLKTVNFSAEYWDRVFRYFLDEHKAGRTPNPDVLCNTEIKFKAFLEHALGLGAELIATGHYARVEQRDGRYCLLKARDVHKDQTYFLYALGQLALACTLFPLGALAKDAVRAIARETGLPNAERRDSTGICFIGEREFRPFLKRFLPARPGEIRALDGRCLGRHEGVMYYTIGQRHGLGIGGPGAAWYVADKDLATNTLYVVQGERHPALYGQTLVAAGLSWVADRPPALPLACRARIRYRQDDQACTIEAHGAGRVRVRFDAPQRAITPGQSVVFYRGEVCLGGGVIEDRGRAADAA